MKRKMTHATRVGLAVLSEAGMWPLRSRTRAGSRMGMWRRQAVQLLIDEVTGNILGEAAGSKIT